MNADTAPLALGGYAFAIAGAILGIWLTVALLRSVFRIRDATERSAGLLARIAAKLDPPTTGAAKIAPEVPFEDVITFQDVKGQAEFLAWSNKEIRTKSDLAAFRAKNLIAGA
jgi:hypothetical protein